MAQITSLGKAIIFVQDMQKQVSFYQDKLGLQVKAPTGISDFSEMFWVEFETGGCTLVLHGGSQGRIGEDAPKMAFQVDDIDGIREKLMENGVTLGAIRSPAPGVKVCDGIDPEGNHFSLDWHE